jgi:hypothetical protein
MIQKTLALALALATAVATLVAAPVAAQQNSNAWQFTVKGIATDVDVPFSSIAKDLQIGGMVHFDMMNDRWVVSSDIIYMDLEDDQALAEGTVTASMQESA